MRKEKYLQIFNYLLEFSKLRSNPVRNIETSESQYPEKIWFADIHPCDIFDSITFPDYNQEADYWLRISKPKAEPQIPTFPKLSRTLTDWIVKESLTNNNGNPVLHESIIRNGKTAFLSDDPEAKEEFENYLDNKWIDDLKFYKKEFETYEKDLLEYEKQSEIYKKVFTIYNKAQQFGEEFELVVGVGLLYFRENENTPLICRHIFTSKAEIIFEFSQRESFLKVSPSIDNEIQIETDAILDLFDQFDSVSIIEAEKKVNEFLKNRDISDNPFDQQIKEAIQIFADRIRTDGQFKNDLEKPANVLRKPTVYFAPALLLRKRNTRSFTALYEKIIENINNSEDEIDIPSMNDLIGDPQMNENISQGSENIDSSLVEDETIYFPKKYNDEQIEIIEKARKNNKVLVQGPPGTGKSHTIANLISHLLANGKKVLVTAYTKRALEVLKDQLPKDFQNLTVNLLSGDSNSIQDLDSSVNAINDELSRVTNLSSFKKEIEHSEKQLSFVKEQRANAKNEWLKVKEKSTRRLKINRYYQGTLTEIAEQTEKDASYFTWFKDESTDINKIPLITDVKEFYSLNRHYESIDSSAFSLILPQKGKLFLAAHLMEYRGIITELGEKYSLKEKRLTISCNDFSELKKHLKSLYKFLSEIENNRFPFKGKLINDYRSDLLSWKDKVSRTNNLFIELQDEKLKQLDRSVEVIYPIDKSLIQLKNDALSLFSYLNDGNALTGILFNLKKALLPKNIKEKLYFLSEVKVNGSPCDTIEEFKTVLDDIRIKQEFEELEAIWKIKVNGNSRSYFDKAQFYKKLKEETEALIGLLKEVNEVKQRVETISSIKIRDFESSKTLEVIEETDYNHLLTQANIFKEKIVEVNSYLSIQNIHPIAIAIKEAISNVNIQKYEYYLSEIDLLNSEKEKYSAYKLLQINLKNHFPALVEQILEYSFDVSNFENLENAIYFKHAYSEITKLLAEDHEKELLQKLSDFELQEEKLISTIAAKKAWFNVLEGLNRNFLLRQHLQAWVQAVKKIGKTGTGKRALKFRKEAQHQMEKCKDSVPCWIMPLYKVAETINPGQGMYDYVIIDEASQLGADAIFLLYISKNIIIVGDDKQTSPEYVGVDANIMTPHINRHLQNIPFANYYGTEFSFFDHAKRFCNGMTVLREHFRCMPEIIEFCNRHFYAPDGKGLYPLKQYSENRIEPLKTVYCQNGYTDGEYQKIINKPEAEAIANQIAELSANERYKGKTFGVITLQGNKQADLINGLILKKIGEQEYKKRKIVCGNSASFQGDERDIMFLSLITAHNHKRQALTDDNDKRRFNVAVSRAKEQIWLFHSILPDDLANKEDLRFKLLDHFLNFKPQPIPPQRLIERTLGNQPEPFESWFEVDVHNDIVTNNYNVIPQYEVAKGRYRIDLVVILSNGIKLAVECDGDKFHGAEQFENDLMRQRVLERCGWQFFRVRGAEYYSDRKKSLEPLWRLIHINTRQKEDIPTATNQNNESNNKAKETPAQEIPTSDNIQDLTQIHINKSNSNPSNSKLKITTPPNLLLFPEFLVFTLMGNVYKVPNNGFSNKMEIIQQIEFEAGEKPIYVTGTKDYQGYLITGFENGKVAKISFLSYQTEFNRKKIKNAYNDESKLIFIEHIENDIDLVVLSSINKVVLFNTSKINAVESRITKGVQVMKSKHGSIIIKVRKLDQVKLQDPEYYRKDESLNVVGYYLKDGDEL